MQSQLVKCEHMIELRKYHADQDQTYVDEKYFFPAEEVLLETDWTTIEFERWNSVPAGYKELCKKLIIAKHTNGKYYAIIIKRYDYSLDNALQEEHEEDFEIYELPREDISKILKQGV